MELDNNTLVHQEMEEIINPGEFTEKELLKLVYRDLHRLRTEFEDYKKTNNVQTQFQELQMKIFNLESQANSERELRIENKKQIHRILYILTFAIAAVQFILSHFIK